MYRGFRFFLFTLFLFCLSVAHVWAQHDSAATQTSELYEEESAIYTEEDIKNEEAAIQRVDISAITDPIPQTERAINKQQWEHLKSDPQFIYIEEKPKPESSDAANSWANFLMSIFEFFASTAGKVVIWLLVAVLVVSIIVWVLKQNGNLLFARKDKKFVANTLDELSDEYIPENWEQTIMEAAMAGDYRLAVRHGYRYLLFSLQEKELINYQTAKTNYQYAYELAGTQLHQPFVQLTRAYEYVWYGDFPIEKAQFDEYYRLVSKNEKRIALSAIYMNLKSGNKVFYFFALLLLTAMYGCDFNKNPKTDWALKLDKESKDPYGFYLAYHSLQYLFPEAKVEALKASTRLTNLGYTLRKNKGKSLVVLAGMQLNFSAGELDSLFSFIKNGHQVLLAVNQLDTELLQQLNVVDALEEAVSTKKEQTIYLRDSEDKQLAYPYHNKDYSIYGHFDYRQVNEKKESELGTNQQNEPNFIVYSIGDGKLFLHASPISLTNYFLLQHQNKDYLSGLFGFISQPVTNVYWVDFYYRQNNKSDWSVIWNNPATRYALLLALFALGVYLLFEIKRKQKVIPIVPPVENSSVAFVETIGRLYYNKKNHSNLAEKMVQHFLEFVRTNYYLTTHNMDDEFVRHLAAKSGQSLAITDGLVANVKEVLNGRPVNEALLYTLHKQIQDFYNGK